MTETLSSARYNPCKGRPDRYPACSDHCTKPEHEAWKAERERIRENRRNHRSPAWVRRLFPKVKDAKLAIGCGKNVLYEWSCGVAPSAVYLRRLHELGADVIWILTGRRVDTR